jgi:hypothetical protein
MSFDPPIIAQAVEVFICPGPGISQRELAEAICGEKG